MIRIKAEKIIQDKCKMYKIVRFKALGYPELPQEYLEHSPYCYVIKDTLRIWPAKGGYRRHITVGDVLSEADFGKLIHQIKDCGKRLVKINANRRKKELAEWQGIVQIKI